MGSTGKLAVEKRTWHLVLAVVVYPHRNTKDELPDSGVRAPLVARFHALASITLWAVTLPCRRLLSYT